MDITPMDIVHKEFGTGLRGFNKEEVRGYLAEVGNSLENLLRDRAQLLAEIDTLKQNLERYHKLEENLQATLMLAQRTSEETTANANKKAEMIIEEARREAETIKQQLGGIRGDKERFLLEFQTLLETYLKHVATLRGEKPGGRGE
jgi:cell division initiation protein